MDKALPRWGYGASFGIIVQQKISSSNLTSPYNICMPSNELVGAAAYDNLAAIGMRVASYLTYKLLACTRWLNERHPLSPCWHQNTASKSRPYLRYNHIAYHKGRE